MVLLSSIALSAACDSGAPDATPGNPVSADTEINLVISDPDTAAEELAMLIDFVSYRITCPASGLTPYDDSVDLTGNLEAVVDANPAVWQLVTDLPLSQCTITLWVFYEDEVICSGWQSMPVLDDGDPSAPNKVNIALECSLSVIPPSGDLDVDGNFDLVHGNYCPQLFWLGAVPTADPSEFTVQTSSMDIDNTCGQNCDPQTCNFSSNPPTCTPAPDPGLSSTLFAPAGNGAFGDPNALNTTYACDPLLPGPTEICVRVSDGDVDCDRLRCLTIECPDLCDGMSCDDGNECTRDQCDPLTGLCSNDPAPNGIACNDCNNTCQAGACTGAPFTADFSGSFMFIQANLEAYTATLVNPYSGESVPVSGTFRVNNASYKGIGTADVLSGVNVGEVLLIKDGVYPQTVCGVETILGQGGFDVLFLADDFITLQDMVIDGGNTNDLIWANVGQDTVRGNNGDDRLDGGPGDDIVEGGSGNDTITLWPGSGFDSISGGLGLDRVEILAIQSQIEITAAASPSYEFDIFYLGTPMAEIREVELVVLEDATINLATCTGPPADICNLCGNDALNGGEECDDGNNVGGDGCAADCTAEY
jgi:cysteine-rich repeat protein